MGRVVAASGAEGQVSRIEHCAARQLYIIRGRDDGSCAARQLHSAHHPRPG
eukprot:SAG11_NODE_449_length_9392_cov_16.435381_10_plen_51_part_00